jgi:hypothetical protein
VSESTGFAGAEEIDTDGPNDYPKPEWRREIGKSLLVRHTVEPTEFSLDKGRQYPVHPHQILGILDSLGAKPKP